MNFSSLVRNRTLLSKEQAVNSIYYRQRANCTFPRRDILKLLIEDTYEAVTVDFVLCIDTSNIQVRAKIHHPSFANELVTSSPNNLMTSTPTNLQLYSDGFILELMSLRKPNGRLVFTDFYHIQFDVKLNPALYT